MKNLFNDFHYTEDAIEISAKLKDFLKSLNLDDYNPIEVESVINRVTHNFCNEHYLNSVIDNYEF